MDRDHLPLVDAETVRAFVEIIHVAAARALKGVREPGMLQLVRIPPDVGSPISTRFQIGDVDLMTEDAIRAAADGFNVYVEGRTVEARAIGRGKTGATRGVFAFVDDADYDKGKGGALRLTPSLTVETSPGNWHAWLFLDRALTADEAEPLGRAMRAATGSDSATAKLTQPYRVAGTPNLPDARKRARGRTVTPTRILMADGPVWSAAALAEAFPPVAVTSQASAPTGRSGQASSTVEDIVAEAGPDRSGRFFHAVLAAIRAGLLPDDLEEVMRRHPGGCASKYLEPYDRLHAEIERAWPKAAEKLVRPQVDPTYLDRAVPVSEAREAVREAVRQHLAAGSGFRAIRVGTGVGKTRIAAEMIAADIQARRTAGDTRVMLYAVPRHKLGDEVVALFEAQGVSARVFRGRRAENPDEPSTKMCLDLESVDLALRLGASVSSTCCKGKHPVTGTETLCPLYHACPYQAQVADRPDVWVVPHQVLFQAQKGLGDVAGVFIDESFWQAGLWASTKGLTLDEVGAGPNLGPKALDDIVADVAAYRGRLARALRRQVELGGVARLHLDAERIDAVLCTEAIAAEWRLKESVPIWPGMSREARRAAAASAKGVKHTQAFIRIWEAARELLYQGQDAVSGRLYLVEADTDEGVVRSVRTRGLKPIATRWAELPTFAMDATLPDIAILRRLYPDIEIVADIEAAAPHARVRQVLGAPVSTGKLLRSEADRTLTAIRRAILHRYIDTGRQPTLVVAQKAVAEWLTASGMPAGVQIAHFNAIAGLDGFKDVRLLIAIGRTLPSVLEVEDMAGAMTGLEAARTAQPDKGPRWYEKAALGLRMRDGSGLAVDGDRHPDPTAEAIRWQICEGELMQTVGRARAVNRTTGNPVDIELWNDVVLPVTVDEVTRWDDMSAGAEVEMLVDGIVLESPSDMAVCWPKVWGTEKAAERWREKVTRPLNPIDSPLYRDWGACDFRYQRPGPRQKWRQGWHDPTVLADPCTWLEARLGTLAGFERGRVHEQADQSRNSSHATAPCLRGKEIYDSQTERYPNTAKSSTVKVYADFG